MLGARGQMLVASSQKKETMKIMFVLIGSSFVLAIGFLIAFIWMVKNGQIDDDYTPSVRMLFDDGTVKKQDEEKV
jgi:cbb3-type cytochrome oxidase maturation protein